ncbi:hypothetical protein PISMIDRAFT_361267 [Pisolithus microcarpus 441]|uniref:Uncharacterized protein n=1 Tax=Pisolithus microcarpus 441 TaxID=765257 RepID=A0A0C9ZZ60_9AGAM|nr:hypothetical protein PISMIDRAFT_361267 [Pisolithus microcarpus 441]
MVPESASLWLQITVLEKYVALLRKREGVTLNTWRWLSKGGASSHLSYETPRTYVENGETLACVASVQLQRSYEPLSLTCTWDHRAIRGGGGVILILCGHPTQWQSQLNLALPLSRSIRKC